jgi:diguanylate cyclase (GGDEF)-like protein/PAS domain S-box-containing protein/putative nucleotidyltransferase with HDIG domain
MKNEYKNINTSLLESIINSTVDAIYAKDIQGNYVMFNVGAEKVTGKSSADILGKNDYALFLKEEALKIMAMDREVIDQKKTISFEERITDTAGKSTVLHNVKSPLVDQHGEIIGVFGIARDITDQKNTENELIESEEKFRNLYSAMIQGMALHEIIMDKNGKCVDYVYLDINESYTRLFGVTKEQVVGKRITEVMPKVEPYWIEVFGKVAQTGRPLYYENYLETTGKYYSTYTYSPQKNQFAVIVDDITERRNIEEKLIESEQRFKALFESSGAGIGFYDPKGIVISYNRLAAENMGGNPEDFAGKSIFELFPKDNADMYFDRISRACDSDTPQFYEDEVPLPNGTQWFSSVFTRIFNLKGEIQGVQIISSNITERKQMENLLRENEQRFVNLYEKAPLGYQSLDENGHFIEVNNTWLTILGYKKDEVIGKWFGDFLADEFVEAFRTRFPIFKSLGSIHSEFIMKRKDGTQVYIAFDGQIGHKKDGSFDRTYCILKDITQEKEKEDKIYYLSYHDHLTGLYNRRFYEEELKRLDTQRNLPLTLIMGDVNGLKLINDTFGHASGDELLIKAAQAMRGACRKDEIIARLGGDEFVIILPKAETAEASKIVSRIKDLLAVEKIETLDISISFGFETKRTMDQDTSKLLKDTEDAMYKHKLYESSSMRSETINLIMKALFEKNSREMLHSTRVSELCQAIAQKMNLDKEIVNRIRITGLMHDIGKIAVDEKILNSSSSLTDDEWQEIRKHPEIGFRILSSSNEFYEISKDVLQHHERWDGKGYPNGLHRDEISIQARIIAVADTYDAMSSDRAYRKAFGRQEVVDEMRRCAGTQFDPAVVDALITLLEKSPES